MNRKEFGSNPRKAGLVRKGLALMAACGVALGAAAGCLERPICGAGDFDPNVTPDDPCAPGTSNVFVDRIEQSVVDKIDLLFMIDNSASMADKQEILAAAVPDLVERLVNPVCVNEATGEQFSDQTPNDPAAPCPDPLTREFVAVNDIHIGIVTSSLGGHGADSCSPEGSNFNPNQNDNGRLIARRLDGSAVDTAGLNNFLGWNPTGKPPGGGFGDVNALNTNFTEAVRGANENGCGFEASLEAWYRFLIQPDPYDRIERVPCYDGDMSNGCAARAGTDAILLEQRAQFLRPDSLVAVIMLSDENDCSVKDDGQFFISVRQQNPDGSLFHLPRPTDVCFQNPNDPCCQSCGQGAADGCPDPAGSPQCQIDGGFYGGPNDQDEDSINLRCFDQKRRFGIDFLYPVSRYVQGLKAATVPDRAGNQVNNPLYSNLQGTNVAPRVPGGTDRIFLAGILGVPWELIDDEQESVDRGTLIYKNAEEIANDGLWDAIVGPCGGTETDGQCDIARGAPAEPLMIETVDPRPVGATGPAGAPIEGPGAGFLANGINGHDWNIAGRDDLQYACIFPLDQPRPMVQECNNSTTTLKPLCQDQNGGYGDTQFYAKAFPTTRELEVLKGFGANSIVASICARNVNAPQAADFGYRPAIAAIVERLKEQLQDRCLPRALALDDQGQVPCAIVEARRVPQTACTEVARSPVDSKIGESVYKQLAESGACTSVQACASEWSLCNILPAGGTPDSPQYGACLTQPNPATDVNGWCYVDPAVTGTPETIDAQNALVEKCPATQRRKLRFVNEGRTTGGIIFIACVGEAI